MRTLLDIATDPQPGDVAEVGPLNARRRWQVLRIRSECSGYDEPLQVHYSEDGEPQVMSVSAWRLVLAGDYAAPEFRAFADEGWAPAGVAK